MKTLLWSLLIVTNVVAPTWAQDMPLVVTTDFSSFGRLREFTETAPWTVSGDRATIPGDAIARFHDDLLYVLGRGGANLLQVYDPAEDYALVREFSLGAGRNPQDIAFDSAGEAYVSCYDQAVLLRVDVAAETVVATYSTAAYADADGLPETAWTTAVDDRLYITCQKLDRDNWYAPTGPGQLLVFDMAAERFDAPIDLLGGDPYTQLEQVPDGNGGVNLRVGCAGFFGLADAGIETVDTTLGTTLGYDVTGSELGGDVIGFVTAGDFLYVLIADASFSTSLRRYDLVTGQVNILDSSEAYVHADVVYDGGDQVIIADRTEGASGLRVFEAVSGVELTSGVLATGLPPFMIIWPVGDPVSAVVPVTVNGHLALSAPYPNPCNPRADIALSGLPAAVVAVRVFDLRGRRVNSDVVRLDGAGIAVWSFDGRNSRGQNLSAGVYRVVAQTASGFAARTVTLLK